MEPGIGAVIWIEFTREKIPGSCILPINEYC